MFEPDCVSKPSNEVLLVFRDEESAVSLRDALGFPAPCGPRPGVFRFCGNHKRMHPLEWFIEGHKTCKFRANDAKAWLVEK